MLLSLLLHLGSATWLSTSNEIVFSLRFFGGSFEGWGGGGLMRGINLKESARGKNKTRGKEK